MRETVGGDIGGEGTGSVDLSTVGRMVSILERTMGAEGIIHI